MQSWERTHPSGPPLSAQLARKNPFSSHSPVRAHGGVGGTAALPTPHCDLQPLGKPSGGGGAISTGSPGAGQPRTPLSLLPPAPCVPLPLRTVLNI